MQVRQLAREGLVRQGGQTFENARKVGESYLAAISEQAGDSVDGTVARVASQAAAQHLYPESAYQAQNHALQALAAGIGGPIGPALASIGYQAMHKTIWHQASYAYHDGRSVSAVFLDGIATHSQDSTERKLARAARKSAADYLYNETAFNVQAEALRRIRDGVAGQDVATSLAEFGRAARMKSLDNENARKVAGPILGAIAANGSGRDAAIAEVTRQASAEYLRQDAASMAQDVGFAVILEGSKGSIAQDLADLGTRSLNHCKYAEDQRNLGHSILRGLARHAEDPAARLTARVADEITCPRLYNASAAGTHYDAFSLIAEGGSPQPDHLVARLGKAVLERGETVSDSRTMGHGVLNALAENASDRVKKGVLEGALLQSAQASSDQVAVGIQRFAFKWVQSAPSVPEAPPSSQDSLEPTVLQQRIGLHESIKTMLQEEISSQSAQIAGKTTEMQALADRFNPMVDTDQKLIKRVNLARMGLFVGGGALLAGVLLQPGMVGEVVKTGLVFGGMATAVASFAAMGNANQKRRLLLAEFWPQRHAYDRLDGEVQALQGAGAATRSMLGPIEQAIQADQSRLEVLEISQAIYPSKTGAIKFDREMVTIGAVRINRAKPKLALGEDQDAPAVSGSTA